MPARMEVILGDITKLSVDAIVNAANESLLGGGGVDGAIHAAAGNALLAECRNLGGCPTGQVRLTKGYRLPARHIIHAVGPIWSGGHKGEPELLRSCYREAMSIASDHKLETIAFPCISTGIFGYPKNEACLIATSEVSNWLDTHEFPKRVIYCCFGKDDFQLYSSRLDTSI